MRIAMLSTKALTHTTVGHGVGPESSGTFSQVFGTLGENASLSPCKRDTAQHLGDSSETAHSQRGIRARLSFRIMELDCWLR